MQLIHQRAVGVVLLGAALLLPGRAGGDSRVDLSLSYFVEPQVKQQLHVIHPHLSLDIEAHRLLTIRVGYDVDIVTGATARVYGATVDAVSSATRFSDQRHQVHGALELRLGAAAIEAGYTFATERDYRSHAIDAAGRVDLWGKNTTFRLGYSHNFDSVCNADNRGAAPLERVALASSTGCFDAKQTGLVAEPLSIDGYFAAWSQVLSPILLSEVSVTFQALDGFQSNPYRRVQLFNGTVDAQENEPRLRQRVAVQARLRVALKKIHGALAFGGRYYWDTWNVRSGTAELSWDQYLGEHLILRLRGRFYQQTRALFYRDAGEALSYDAVGPVGQYFTGDRELSPFRNWLAGAKLTYLRVAGERGKLARVFEAVDLSLKLDLLMYEALTALPPNASRSQGAIDAILVHAGLTLHW